MALLYLGSLFETLDYALPPERDEAKLDALAWHILDKRPKTRALVHKTVAQTRSSARRILSLLWPPRPWRLSSRRRPEPFLWPGLRQPSAV